MHSPATLQVLGEGQDDSPQDLLLVQLSIFNYTSTGCRIEGLNSSLWDLNY